MKTKLDEKSLIGPPVRQYLEAIRTRNAEGFAESFAAEAVVNDAGREIRGLTAIRKWAEDEIFAVEVTLEIVEAAQRDGETILTVKIDGTFDRTGLPDPLLMDHCFTLAQGKITALACRFAQK